MFLSFIINFIMASLAIDMINLLHVKKFTLLWSVINLLFFCLTYTFGKVFLTFLISSIFSIIPAYVYYYSVIYKYIPKEIWNEIARELYDSEEDLERFKLDFERHTEMTLESFKDKAKCFTHEKVTEFKFNGFKLSIQDNFHTLYKLKK